MKATARLYLTACATALVAAGDPRAARLYASPGDDIPDSAAEKFGLVDGDIAEGKLLTETYLNAILRVALGQGTGLTELEVAGLSFGADWRPFAKGEMDIAQLLAIVQHPSLTVEALQFVDDEAHHWAPIPGFDMFLPLLERQVAAAQTLGLAMPGIGEEIPAEIASFIWAPPIVADEPGLPVDPTPPIDDVPPPPPPVTSEPQELSVKEADAPAETKEKAPAEDKEKKGGSDKSSGRSTSKAQAKA
ncbi:hypothetical protein KRZ98_06265 [Sphingobium sp. AS12]|uniref:hypothetical protein n=1 Tax=Sphingobium sp. AS12 TaxID=2849495 RepID=UPI001C314CDE|nr:hypothetical protein [Sphingobium sp. AS12]MBV2147894.1 hypothetical protein [Sphingobium sp. AS12]